LRVSGLAACANLAIPGVGSTTVSDALGAALVAANLSRGAHTPWGHPALRHHKHQLRPHHLRYWGARCFVAAVRDPAARLATALAWESKNTARTRNMHLYSKSRNVTTPAQLVDAMRDPAHKFHRLYWKAFNGSYANASWGGLYSSETLWRGNPFLVPQVDWFRDVTHDPRHPAGINGIDPRRYAADTDVHILCLETLDADWAAFVEQWASTDLSTPAGRRYMEETRARGVGHLNPSRFNHSALAARRSAFDYSGEAQRQWVRECLYPEDTALWRRACGTRVRIHHGIHE